MYDETMVQPAHPLSAHQPNQYQPNQYQADQYHQQYDPQAHVLGPEVAPAGRPNNNKKVIAIVIAVIVAVNLLGAVVVLATRSSNQIALTGAETKGVVTSVPQVSQVPVPGDSVPVPSDVPSTVGTPSGQAQGQTGAPTGKPAGGNTGTPAGNPGAPAPVITSFTTTPNIDCHNGNFQMFSASWTTTNATRVTISIDGPGVYKTYAANGSDSLPFNCSSAHSFLLTAYGQDGKTVTKTVTLQPRNVQKPPTQDDEGTQTTVSSIKNPAKI